jgi:hypothetical protein
MEVDLMQYYNNKEPMGAMERLKGKGKRRRE